LSVFARRSALGFLETEGCAMKSVLVLWQFWAAAAAAAVFAAST